MSDPQTIRVAPSGPPVENSAGGGLTFGDGARLRLGEFGSVLGDGSVPVPTLATETTLDGFTTGAPTRVLLLLPSSKLKYRARVKTDVICTNTNTAAEVQLFLDTSVDAGVTWTNRQSSSHHVSAATDLSSDVSGARQIELNMLKIDGATLGVAADGSTPSLTVRVRMACPTNPAVELYSPATPAPGAANGVGTFHVQLEEVF